jgi:ABC-2 type transport system permease protein
LQFFVTFWGLQQLFTWAIWKGFRRAAVCMSLSTVSFFRGQSSPAFLRGLQMSMTVKDLALEHLEETQSAPKNLASPKNLGSGGGEPTVREFGGVNWLGLGTLLQKEVQRFFKIPLQTIAAPAITSLMFLLIFNLAIAKFRPAVEGVPFAIFIAPGLIMMGVLQNAFANTASSLLSAKIQGNMVDFLMPPLSSGELAAAFALGGAIRGVVVAIVTAVLIMPFLYYLPPHLVLTVKHPLAALFFGFGAALMLSQVGLLAGIWADKWDHMSTVTNFVIMPLTFLSGTFYSVKQLPGAVYNISQINPFFYLIDGFRYSFTGNHDSNLLLGVAIVVVLNFFLWISCLAVLRSGYKLKA